MSASVEMRAVVDPVRTVIEVAVQGLVGTGMGRLARVLQLPHHPCDDRSRTSTALSLGLDESGAGGFNASRASIPTCHLPTS